MWLDHPLESSLSLKLNMMMNLGTLSLGVGLARTSLLCSQTHLTHFPSTDTATSTLRPLFLCINHTTSLSASLPIQTLILDNPHKSDTVEHLLQDKDCISRLMKMDRKPIGLTSSPHGRRWFPYLDNFRAQGYNLSSQQVVAALEPYMLEPRKDKFRNVVKNRSYGVCLVVEGLTDLGNVSAAIRSADALGVQSVHVVSCGSKRLSEYNST